MRTVPKATLLKLAARGQLLLGGAQLDFARGKGYRLLTLPAGTEVGRVPLIEGERSALDRQIVAAIAKDDVRQARWDRQSAEHQVLDDVPDEALASKQALYVWLQNHSERRW